MAEDIIPDGGSVDLSATQILPAVDQQTIPPIPTSTFDPEPERERIRGRIALTLLAMLAGVLLLTFISMWFGMNAEVLRTVLTIVFGPLVTLVSAATGFYYGSRSN